MTEKTNFSTQGHGGIHTRRWVAQRWLIDNIIRSVGIIGSSFGSFFSTIAGANEPRFRACAVSATCLEPGCHTIFEEASPTFTQRFMWMSGYTDKDAFDPFRRTLTWEGHAEKIRVPYLCIAGEADELCPLEHSERWLVEAGGNIVKTPY
jgi:dipeptidyl aminopeptidase/acylaminoacyl peptidase